MAGLSSPFRNISGSRPRTSRPRLYEQFGPAGAYRTGPDALINHCGARLQAAHRPAADFRKRPCAACRRARLFQICAEPSLAPSPWAKIAMRHRAARRPVVQIGDPPERTHCLSQRQICLIAMLVMCAHGCNRLQYPTDPCHRGDAGLVVRKDAGGDTRSDRGSQGACFLTFGHCDRNSQRGSQSLPQPLVCEWLFGLIFCQPHMLPNTPDRNMEDIRGRVRTILRLCPHKSGPGRDEYILHRNISDALTGDRSPHAPPAVPPTTLPDRRPSTALRAC